MATTTVQVVQVPQVIVPGQPLQPPPPPANVSRIKGLAITQLVIGIISGIFGIAAIVALYKNTWTTNTGAGIWAGVLIAITGMVGLCSVRNRNFVYMAFNIMSTCVAGLCGIFCIAAVAHYSISDECFIIGHANGYISGSTDYDSYEYDCTYRDVGLGLYAPLLILMIIAFFVSIFAAVYCCQNGCGQRSQGVVINQPYMVAGQPAVMTTTGVYQANVQYGGQMAPQPGLQMAPQYGGQMAPQYGVQMMPQYGGQMAPQPGVQMAPQYGGQMAQQNNTQVPPRVDGVDK